MRALVVAVAAEATFYELPAVGELSREVTGELIAEAGPETEQLGGAFAFELVLVPELGVVEEETLLKPPRLAEFVDDVPPGEDFFA